jgi:PAS domain S-box-containing protein
MSRSTQTNMAAGDTGASADEWMFESSPDCVKLLDINGHLLAMNANGMRAMEIDDFSGFCGQEWRSLWPEESHTNVEAALDTARNGKTGRFYAFRPTAKGTPKWWDVIVTPVRNHSGQIQKLLSVSRDVTAIRQAEEDRKTIASQLRLALDAAGLGTWHFESAGEIFSTDQRFRAIFGFDTDYVDYETALLAIHLEDRDRVLAAVNAANRPDQLEPYDIEYRVVHPNNEIRWVAARGQASVQNKGRNSPLISFNGTILDITERKRAEEERAELLAKLKSANDRMVDIFQRAPAFMCVLRGPEHVFELTNDRYLDLVNKQNLIDKPVRQALPEIEGQGFFELLDNVYQTGEAFTGTNVRLLVHRHVDQLLEERFIDFVYLPLRDISDKVSGILVHGVDLTDRKLAEDALRQVASELSETDRRKSEFLATLAHELRNPLAPIRNGLHVLRLSKDNPNQVEKVREMMERQVTQMVRLVDDLLDIARISSGKIELKKERSELKKIVLSAVETSLPIIEASHHEFSVSVAEEPVFLDVDAARISQILSNLLNNAAKYTPSGGRIALSACIGGNKAVFSVTDTGVGITPDAFASVFDLFSQVRSQTDRSQGGLGIGLSLVRRLVEMHGGTVSVASQGANKGSTFTVFLPLTDVVDASVTIGVEDQKASLLVQNKKLRVLVVDDNVDAADSLASLLKISGHTVRTANDGRHAFQLAEDFRPDVAFLDIGLPGMNGYELATALRNRSGLQKIMLIALTGWGTKADLVQARTAGFDHHLTKPANLDAVDRLLSKI